jgi:hypothetical protein
MNTGEPIADVGAAMTGAGLMNQAPTEFALYPCSPNPFNAKTVASFELRVASEVSLRVYDTAGRSVMMLVNGWREAGRHEATFDAGELPSGMYFCRIQAGEFNATQKMVLLKRVRGGGEVSEGDGGDGGLNHCNLQNENCKFQIWAR